MSAGHRAGRGRGAGRGAHARARGTPVEIVAAYLPFAPARVRELDVVLVLATHRARVDGRPVERVAAVEPPALDGGRARTEVNRDHRDPEVGERGARIARVGREQPESMSTGHAMQQREIPGGGIGAQHGARHGQGRVLTPHALQAYAWSVLASRMEKRVLACQGDQELP